MNKIFLASIFLCVSTISNLACSAVLLQKTRVILEPGSNEAELTIDAQKNVSSLVQTWVSGPDNNVVSHFTIMPSISLLKAGQSQTLRLVYQGDGVPQDRESLLYLNIQDSVAVSDELQGKNAINSSFLQVIKGFYRPNSLTQEGAAEAPLALTWEVRRRNDASFSLRLINPSPFHVVFSGISLVTEKNKNGKISSVTNTSFDYIKPYSTSDIEISNTGNIANIEKIVYLVINDYGMTEAYSSNIKSGRSIDVKKIPRRNG
ncbi:fimbrial biogenesis chaperone [Hafnia paralvei]|jgi:chaperone protein EcpD|uniref:fimbrial biogenesis chaperone n=1 Tax=Hafnia paralvei TaxID=546367 RepID=UPI001034B681|nr:molecular chaperone [Hafnia paralvei]MDX6842872.1 molecular chaperone [Hafnia paralvei]TBM05983.1 molecular chaperone [Hafnia paralvei]TBM29372.1 molecular chaperone [Hafnia paralvei]